MMCLKWPTSPCVHIACPLFTSPTMGNASCPAATVRTSSTTKVVTNLRNDANNNDVNPCVPDKILNVETHSRCKNSEQKDLQAISRQGSRVPYFIFELAFEANAVIKTACCFEKICPFNHVTEYIDQTLCNKNGLWAGAVELPTPLPQHCAQSATGCQVEQHNRPQG